VKEDAPEPVRTMLLEAYAYVRLAWRVLDTVKERHKVAERVEAAETVGLIESDDAGDTLAPRVGEAPSFMLPDGELERDMVLDACEEAVARSVLEMLTV
jgi:hypothetical protein